MHVSSPIALLDVTRLSRRGRPLNVRCHNLVPTVPSMLPSKATGIVLTRAKQYASLQNSKLHGLAAAACGAPQTKRTHTNIQVHASCATRPSRPPRPTSNENRLNRRRRMAHATHTKDAIEADGITRVVAIPANDPQYDDNAAGVGSIKPQRHPTRQLESTGVRPMKLCKPQVARPAVTSVMSGNDTGTRSLSTLLHVFSSFETLSAISAPAGTEALLTSDGKFLETTDAL
mmetsp:Transcript_45760/g.104848  ORF Transcript_45760/g.104848 Transcript_45760/m.104848 type:complete len:231 (-) Transcript_45760:147-839(-)